TVDTNLGPEFKAIMSYTDDSAILTLMFEFSGFSQLTPNQLAVANYIDAHDTTITTGDFANGIVPALNAAGMSGQLQHALDELSPQRLQMLSSVAFNNYTFATQHLDDHLTSVRDGAYGLDTSGFAVTDSTLSPDLSQIKSRLLAWSPAPTPGMLSDASSVLGVVKASDPKGPDKISEARVPDKNWSAFISGNVVLAHVDQTSDVAKSNYTTGGATAGLDYRVTTNLRVGALMDYEHTDADLDNEGSKAHIDTYQPGIYLAYADKYGFYANGLLSYGHNDYSEDRNIIFGGLNRTAHGSPSGDQYGLNVDGGFDLHRDGGWTFGPAVGLTYVHLGIDNFSESGADAASLNINSQSADSLRTRLGVDIRYSDKIASVLLTPHLNISWQHEFMDDSRTLTGQFEQAGLGTFGVQTTGPNRDSALIALGVDAEINSSLTLFLDYLADVGGNDYLGQSAQGGAKLAF
ncbi:MAG TPA: autotransporter outer membrane beta-barrel domain-containing protein, partial [Candidatus Methylacidiphilales bacterium]